MVTRRGLRATEEGECKGKEEGGQRMVMVIGLGEEWGKVRLTEGTVKRKSGIGERRRKGRQDCETRSPNGLGRAEAGRNGGGGVRRNTGIT